MASKKSAWSNIKTFISLLFFLAVLFAASSAFAGSGTDTYDGRQMIVYVPSALPASGKRALVVVLHGGMGNAERISGSRSEKGLNMDSVAEKNGFIVAYLNGTQAARFLGANMLAWNAGGGCCGQPFAKNTNDVGYITGAVGYLAGKYGIDRKYVYGIGHSNGGIMTQRLMCETDLYASGISISGPLTIKTETCPSARGKKIMGIHGADDLNVPITGGVGTKGISRVNFTSEEYTSQVYTKSGATYDLQIVKGADHKLDNIESVIQQTEGVSLAEKAARYFGLVH